MEVAYSRNIDYQYMNITIEEEARSDYQLSMLMNNRLNGFLPVHLQQINGKSSICYEITSQESLSDFFQGRKITYEEMTNLLLQFCGAVQEAGRYLLRGEGILTEPEYIYVSRDMERVSFCYYPFKEVKMQHSLNALCRFLVDHVDYEERKSAELAYELFQESLRDNFTIVSVIESMKKIKEKEHIGADGSEEETVKEQNREKSLDRNVKAANCEEQNNKNEVDTIERIHRDCLEDAHQRYKEYEARAAGRHRLGVWLITGAFICLMGSVIVCLGIKFLHLQVMDEKMLIIAGTVFSVIIGIVGVVVAQVLRQ